MAGIGKLVGGVQQETPKTGAEVTQDHSSFSRVGTATALLALSLVAGQAGAESKKVDQLQTGAQSTLLAQAEVGQTGPYTAEVIQVDGTKKVIKYFRDKNGLIIPPLVENGKLINGEDAPADPLRAKIAQRKILTQYDKLVLVRIEKSDIINKANEDIKKYYELAEQGKLTKEQLFEGFYNVYLIRIGLGNNVNEKGIDGFNKIVGGLTSYGKMKLNLQESEIQSTKQRAETKAKETLERFSSVTA